MTAPTPDLDSLHTVADTLDHHELGAAALLVRQAATAFATVTAELGRERDRADRAEARLREARKAMDTNQTVDGVTDRGWLTPDEWLLDKVAEALGEDESTA